MRDLFLSECRRFRNAAVIFAVAHLLVQLFVHRMSDFLQLRWQEQTVALALYMIAAFAFALYQFGTYRQPSRWLWLLHRPLPPLAIFASIASASVLLIVLAVGMPALLTVIGTDWLTARTVDLRHYLLVLHLVMLTMAAWLCGVCTILSRSRSAIVIVVLPYVLLGHMASAWTMLVPALLCLALLLLAVNGVVKPNRTAPPADRLTMIATAVPLQIGFYLAMLWAGSVGFQSLQMLVGVHPLNGAVPPAGGLTESRRAESGENFLRALATSTDPRAAQWKRQLPMLKIGDIEAMGRQFPVRNQASNSDGLKWVDHKRHLEFTFSHDAMRFHALDLRTGQDRGWLGTGGMGDSGRFEGVPVLPPGSIMTPRQFYRYDSDTQRLSKLIELPPGEFFAWPLRKAVSERLYTLTNQRLIFHAAAASGEPPAELFSVPLPGPFSDLDRIEIAEMLDGTLLSFNYGRRMTSGGGDAVQTVMFVDTDGKAQIVARRDIAHDFPALFEHRDWWLSPLFATALALPEALLDTGVVPDQDQRIPLVWQRTQPLLVLAAALLAALLAAAGAWLWGARSPGWLLACLLIGLPALFSLLVMQPRAQARASPRTHAVPA